MRRSLTALRACRARSLRSEGGAVSSCESRPYACMIQNVERLYGQFHGGSFCARNAEIDCSNGRPSSFSP